MGVATRTVMALYKYSEPTAAKYPLPHPEGPLSSEVSIVVANPEVRPVSLDEGVGKTQKRGHYKHYTADEKARIA